MRACRVQSQQMKQSGIHAHVLDWTRCDSEMGMRTVAEHETYFDCVLNFHARREMRWSEAEFVSERGDDPAVDRIRPMAEKEESRTKRDPAELRGKRSSSSYPILAASSLKLSSEDVELQSSE